MYEIRIHRDTDHTPGDVRGIRKEGKAVTSQVLLVQLDPAGHRTHGFRPHVHGSAIRIHDRVVARNRGGSEPTPV